MWCTKIFELSVIRSISLLSFLGKNKLPSFKNPPKLSDQISALEQSKKEISSLKGNITKIKNKNKESEKIIERIWDERESDDWNSDDENNSKRKKLNPSAILEKIEEKYQRIISDKQRIMDEKHALCQKNRIIMMEKAGLLSNLGVANRRSEEVQNKLNKFNGKIHPNLSKIFEMIIQ